MKSIILAALLVTTATFVSAQVTSTIQNTYCYTGQVECDIAVYQNLVDPAGAILIVFFTGTPAHQGPFTVYEASGAPAALTTFTPKVTWGYVGGTWTADFSDPAGRSFSIDFRQVNSTRYGGLVWIAVSTSKIVGASMLMK